MARIKVKDLRKDEKLSDKDIKALKGGIVTPTDDPGGSMPKPLGISSGKLFFNIKADTGGVGGPKESMWGDPHMKW